MAKKRWYKARPVVEKVEANGQVYDSNLEAKVHQTNPDADHHPDKIPYIVSHTYQPDFKIGNTYVETKGFFQDSAEAAKYKWIRDHLPPFTRLVFVFERPNSPLPWAKSRKCGTRQTHREWAERNQFKVYEVEEEIDDE